jgi:uncharacterized protein DUF898
MGVGGVAWHNPRAVTFSLPDVPSQDVAVSSTESIARYESFAFTGSGPEYFRIWIVNVLLSVMTLGIYSAWAKVRTQRYFYRHTRVAGASFDYHGRPLAILKGRIVSVVLFGGYYIANIVSPEAGAVAFLVLVALLPWLVMRSLKFRLDQQQLPRAAIPLYGIDARSVLDLRWLASAGDADVVRTGAILAPPFEALSAR